MNEGTKVLSSLERAKNDLHLFDHDVEQLLKSGIYQGISLPDLAKLRKSAKDKVANKKKKEQLLNLVGGEEEKVSPNEDSESIDAARQSHAINVFHQEFNVDPTTECLKR